MNKELTSSPEEVRRFNIIVPSGRLRQKNRQEKKGWKPFVSIEPYRLLRYCKLFKFTVRSVLTVLY